MEEELKPQQNIEANSERIKDLKEVSSILKSKDPHIPNAAYYLEKLGITELIPDLAKVELDKYLKILLKYGENAKGFDYATAGSYRGFAVYPTYRDKGILGDNFEYTEVQNAFMGIVAAGMADDGCLRVAKYWYEKAGMTEKAAEYKDYQSSSFPDRPDVPPKEDLPKMQVELKEASEKLKDFPLLSDEEREAIIANVREKVEAELVKIENK